jgi:hypothetical protein
MARDDLIEREQRHRTHFVELVISPLGGAAPTGGDWSRPVLELFVLHRVGGIGQIVAERGGDLSAIELLPPNPNARRRD